jgi:hypothetical protein
MAKKMEFLKLGVGDQIDAAGFVRAAEVYVRALSQIGQRITFDGDEDFTRLGAVSFMLQHIAENGDLGDVDGCGDMLAQAAAVLLTLLERRERRKAEAVRYALRCRSVDADGNLVWLGKHPGRPRRIE